MESLLKDQGDNIYRMKGVLAIEGFDERYVFQVQFGRSPDLAHHLDLQAW